VGMAEAKASVSHLLGTATAEEKAKLSALWTLVNAKLKDSPDPKTNDDALLRILRARQLQVEVALEAWEKWREWRKAFGADSITADAVQRPLRSGKAVWRGHDKSNRPCLIITPRHHWPKESPADETIKLGVYLVEKGIKLADAAGVDQFCIIQDRTGISYANVDWGLIQTGKTLVRILQDFYAERLGVAYILGVNRLYWYMYNLIAPFVDKKSLAKLKVLKDPEELKQYFDVAQLMQVHGGTDAYDYLEDLKTWPDTKNFNWTKTEFESKAENIIEETVARGAKSTIRVACDEGHTVSWKIKTSAHDIGVEVEFWPAQLEITPSLTSLTSSPSATAQAEQAAVKIYPNTRHECHTDAVVGSWKSPGAGEVCILLDNSYSMLRSKTVLYEVSCQSS